MKLALALFLIYCGIILCCKWWFTCEHDCSTFVRPLFLSVTKMKETDFFKTILETL